MYHQRLAENDTGSTSRISAQDTFRFFCPLYLTTPTQLGVQETLWKGCEQ